MSNRKVELRHSQILQNLRATGRVSVDELAKSLRISEVTIRKDLTELEHQGVLIRQFGGAVLAQKVKSLGQEKDPNKSAIAKSAAGLVPPNSRIVIDSGHTTAHMVPFLGDKPGLVVMSNSLQVAQQITLLPNAPTLLMPGGTWDRKTESLQGQVAEQVLRSYDFDILFVGADGIDLARGTTTFNELLNLSRVMAEVSSKVIVMAESHKIARKIPNLELPWSSVDMLVTDAAIEKKHLETIQQHGVTVVVANQE